MYKKIVILTVFLAISAFTAGCASSTGVFATTEERVDNLGASVTNIALDGDGIN